ncbi:MAG: hypothetical protein ACLFMX_01050 [Halobacteriales archaeon]
MTSESSDGVTNERIVLGFSGSRSLDDVRYMLDQLETDVTVARVELEFELDGNVGLSLPGGGRLEAGSAGDGATVPAGARLQRESVPFRIIELLVERDEPMRTEEIAEAIDGELSQNEVASRLWNLANRGLVKKRAYEEDRRQKVYTVSDVGLAALEAAKARGD